MAGRCVGPRAQDPTHTPPGRQQSHRCESIQTASPGDRRAPLGHELPASPLDAVPPGLSVKFRGILSSCSPPSPQDCSAHVEAVGSPTC